jgi:hypothetical protein
MVTVSDYIHCALERLDHWVNKVISKLGAVIVDSGFLQNPINELLFRKATHNETFLFISEIFHRINALNPFCVYLQRNNVEEAISFAKEVKGKAWAERVEKLRNLYKLRTQHNISLEGDITKNLLNQIQ